jgi:isopenicillin-N N-acyltransferase like protein
MEHSVARPVNTHTRRRRGPDGWPPSAGAATIGAVTPPLIPVLRVAGSRRDVGRQIGSAFAEQVRESVTTGFDELPGERTRDAQMELAAAYREVTARELPWLVEELDGCAEAAGVDPLEFFAVSIEEIWYLPRERVTQGRCSDLVAGPRATADGHLLVGHNNDLSPKAESHIVAIERSVPGDPVTFQLGGAPWLSVGWNSAGLSLTGNELSPNDERVGISRSLQVFEMLRARTLEDMVAAALRPDRASSYNNVLTSADGGAVNVEGSATDVELTGLDEDGHLVHTNHYVCERMAPYEGDPNYAVHSNVRYERGRELLAAEPAGTLTGERLRELLADHETRPDSLCKHPEFGTPDSKTVFWCVADVTEGRITFGRGNPCDSQAQTYSFADDGS